jgi:hypothetical protein
MRPFRACLLVLGLLFVLGCPTARSTDKGTAGKNELKVLGPQEAITLIRGKPTEVPITISRPADFKEDLTLKVEISAPRGKKGVTATIEPTILKPGGDGKATLTVTTTENAGEGEYKATIHAIPATGPPVLGEVKFVVPRM